MRRDDARIEAVLIELADLGRRIGQRAGELARLTATNHRSPVAPNADSTRSLAAAAAELAAGAATVVAVSAGAESGAANRDTATPRPPITQSDPQTRGTTLASQRHESRSNTVKQPSTGSRNSGHSSRAKGMDRRVRSVGRGPSREEAACITRSRPVATDQASGEARAVRPWRRAVGPLITSTALHAVAIIIFAMTFIAGTSQERLAITLEMASEPAIDELAPIAIEASDPLADDPFSNSEDQLAEPLPTLEAVAEVPVPVMKPTVPEVVAADGVPAEWSAQPSLESADLGGMLSEIGTGAGNRGGRERAGGDTGGANGGGDTTFFGRTGQGRSVCFLCDNSNSYSNGGFHVVLEEVARAVDALPADQSFFVVFFSDAAYPLFHPEPADALVSATPENKRRLRSWLGTVEMCQGGQGIHEAVRLAGTLGTDTVYLLSDGEFSSSVVDRVEAADFGDAVVHTFGIQQAVVDRRTGQVDPDKLVDQQTYNRNLITIATAHGGGFTPVNIPPVASTLERTRPIPRNRLRGAIWGLKL